jgi:hypothetical protein
MSGFAMLWSKTLDSSIWVKESKETRLVWVTMLMMKDSDGVIQASKVGLADRAKVSERECLEALRILTSPDPNDTSGVEGGRRVQEIPGGWQIVNHDRYRFSTEAKREVWRQQKAQQRERERLQASRKKGLPGVGKPLHGEVAAVKALEGGDEVEFDRIAAERRSGVVWVKSVAAVAEVGAASKMPVLPANPVVPRVQGVPVEAGGVPRPESR